MSALRPMRRTKDNSLLCRRHALRHDMCVPTKMGLTKMSSPTRIKMRKSIVQSRTEVTTAVKLQPLARTKQQTVASFLVLSTSIGVQLLRRALSLNNVDSS